MTTALFVVAAFAIALILAAVAILFSQIEDWRRDLTTNTAATDPNSADERLRPLHASFDAKTFADRVESAVARLPRWKLQSRASGESAIELHFVRTTPLFRFKDDIHIRIVPESGGGSLLTATSRSRIGKGDLGQNPRNLRQLLAAARQAIE